MLASLILSFSSLVSLSLCCRTTVVLLLTGCSLVYQKEASEASRFLWQDEHFNADAVYLFTILSALAKEAVLGCIRKPVVGTASLLVATPRRPDQQ